MDPLSISASIVALLTLTGTVVQYLNSAKGASEDRQNILLEISSVSGLLYQLRDLAERTEWEDSWSKTLKSLSVPKGPLEQFKKVLEILASKLKPVVGWKKAGKAVIWPFQKGEIKDILCTIERQKTLFGLALQQDHLGLSRAIKNGVTEIQAGVTELRVAQNNTDCEKVLRWLSTTDASTNHNAARIKHEPSTGDWFIHSEKFDSWWDNVSQTLWLHGIPGCGKTVLCSTIVELVKGICSITSDLGYAYFYFDFNDKGKQTVEGFLRSMIVQLSVQRPSLPEEVQKLYDVHAKQQQQPNRSNLIETFLSLLKGFRRTHIMMDALDECSERQAMLELIAEMVARDQNLKKVNLLITSRRERDIEITLQDIVTDSICIQSAHIEADIRLHVNSRLSQDSKLRGRPEAVKKEIEKTLVDGANGMFRWVVCQLDSLGKCVSPAAVKRALKTLPKTLDATYARILTSIEDDYRESAHTALQWLAFSARPLRLEEVAEAVAVKPGCGLDFVDDRLFDPYEILAICSSLVTISDESSEIRLAHYSVKEYLTSERVLSGPASAFATFEISTNRDVTELCLTYLSLFDKPDSLSETSLEDFPLLGYAAKYWYKHAQIADEENGIDTLIVEFLNNRETSSLPNWLRILPPEQYWNSPSFREKLSDKGSPLYYASCCGLLSSARRLINEGADVNARGGSYGNALQAAALRSNETICRLLLETGAEVNAQGGDYSTALQAAAYMGNETTVRLLLATGADVKAQGGHHGNALQAAAFTGNETICRVLLETGADVNAQGGAYGNALQAAAFRDNETICRLLLEAGADVNAQGEHYDNALQTATTNGNATIYRLLLKAGADVNAQGEYHHSGLWAGASEGNVTICRLFLKAGADVNAQGEDYGNALQAAAFTGNEIICRVLLETGADVNAQGGDYGNALQAAAFTGNETICRLFLKAGVDVNAQGGRYGNALQAAANRGQKAVFELLLQNGAVITQDGEFDSAWDAASYGADQAEERWRQDHLR
ncbi:MAG: hypothetical protein M1830_006749 [Pleopsidium flavum]|nr:MAG: hypothetical protein M1830_006749 [Pleopsidium flavum]